MVNVGWRIVERIATQRGRARAGGSLTVSSGRMYGLAYRTVLRRIPAEAAHRAGFGLIRLAGAVPGGPGLLRRWFGPSDPVLRVRALGLDLPGPLGLAAGFDKDARGADALGGLGFAFVEGGAVSAPPQPGNPGP